jgi:DNA-binding transcriptional LysR family regulator
LPNGALYRWQFEKNGQPLQIDVRGPITFDEASFARMAVLEGVGIGFFMASDVRDDIASGRLVQILEARGSLNEWRLSRCQSLRSNV